YEVGGAAARTGQHIIPKNNLPGILGNWTKYRDFPEFANKPFRELWKDRENGHTSNGEEA
ncbi:MAG: lactate utilization protein LutB domain-containing protein, partial [Chloroflexota bacterium]